jgi:prepilin-type N-terminal cleavage/methylation domain-containing protein
MLQKLRSNKEGFTLIELMIVIAIIGILAAIAIPNFIAYRNKAFCSAAESDANAVAAAIADYFSNPMRFDVPSEEDLNITLSGDNDLAELGNDPNDITITITDGSGRCPTSYKTGNPNWNGNDYTINMQ